MALSFDGNTIESANFLITDIDHYNIPTKTMNLYSLANSNLSVIPEVDYPSKVIKVTGVMKCDTNTDLEERIDVYKGYFLAKEASLVVPYSSTTRRYVATVNQLEIKRSISLSHATFAIEFVCSNPFGYEPTATEIANETAYTSASLTETPTIGGNAPVQLPVATITLNTITGTGDYVSLSNDLNGQQILLYGLGLANDDVIVIDSENRDVTVNDLPVDYIGTFLELEPGASSVTYADGFTTRDVDILIEYYKRYL